MADELAEKLLEKTVLAEILVFLEPMIPKTLLLEDRSKSDFGRSFFIPSGILLEILGVMGNIK